MLQLLTELEKLGHEFQCVESLLLKYRTTAANVVGVPMCRQSGFLKVSPPESIPSNPAGHSDSVWSLCYSSTRQQLLSCSADGTVKLWSPVQTKSLVNTFGGEEAGMPTCCDWLVGETSQFVVAYSNIDCVIYDAETGKQVIRLDTANDPVSGQVCSHCVLCTRTTRLNLHQSPKLYNFSRLTVVDGPVPVQSRQIFIFSGSVGTC